jgi:hypothetical protein
MWKQVRVAFDQALERAANGFVAFLPKLLAVLLILAIALLVASLLRALLRRFLRSVGFDTLLLRWGLSSAAPGETRKPVSHWVEEVAFWGALLLGLLLALLALDLPAMKTVSLGLFALFPRVIVATLIVLLGLALSRYLERSVLISAVNLQLHSARLLSVGAKWLAIILTAAMALDQLGVGGGIVPLFFGILFGGIVLTLALAIGLGSREAISKELEKRLQQREEPETSRDVQHM